MHQPDSVYWRNKAEEYRTSADSFRDHSARAAYALLAESADALARRQEQLAEHLSAKAGSQYERQPSSLQEYGDVEANLRLLERAGRRI